MSGIELMLKANKVPAALAEDLSRIAALSDPKEIRKLWRGLLVASVENYMRMAALLRRVDELGIKPEEAGIDESLVPVLTLRKMADGQLLVTLVMRLSNPALAKLYKRAARMPLDQQRIIADNEPIPFYALEGPDAKRMIPPLNMLPGEIDQAIAPDHIRGEAEQQDYLRDRRRRLQEKENGASRETRDPQFFPRGGYVIYQGVKLTEEKLLTLLADLKRRQSGH
jgi:hypothetical protein